MNNDERRDEYDYRKAKPNRFAAALKKGGRLVVLEPEVAEKFRESSAVNAVLRALLHTKPTERQRIHGMIPKQSAQRRHADGTSAADRALVDEH